MIIKVDSERMPSTCSAYQKDIGVFLNAPAWQKQIFLKIKEKTVHGLAFYSPRIK
jgi:hypothetical protein